MIISHVRVALDSLLSKPFDTQPSIISLNAGPVPGAKSRFTAVYELPDDLDIVLFGPFADALLLVLNSKNSKNRDTQFSEWSAARGSKMGRVEIERYGERDGGRVWGPRGVSPC